MMNRLKKIEWSRYTILYVLIIFWIIMFLTNQNFRSWTNLSNTLRQASLYGIISIGMTFCIISGSFDLSVGSMVAFIGVFGLSLMNQIGFIGVLAFMLITGIALGLINGLLIAYLKISPFIVTLGTYYTYRAVVLIFTGGEGIHFREKWFSNIGNGDILGLPIPLIIFILLSIIGTVILRRTLFGRHVIALGNSEKASKASGINVKFTKLTIFALLGLLAGLTALLMSARQWSANPSMAKNLHFDAITIVVLGGTKLIGGEGSIFNTFIAAIFYATLNNFMNLYYINANWQGIMIGSLLLLAFSMDAIKEFSRNRRKFFKKNNSVNNI